MDLVNEQFDEDFLKVEAVPYATVEASMEALKNGEVDAVFPIYQSLDEAERIHVLLTARFSKNEDIAASVDEFLVVFQFLLCIWGLDI